MRFFLLCLFITILHATCPDTSKNDPAATVDQGLCCAHPVSDNTKYTPSPAIVINNNNPVVYFDSINCQDENKKNVKFTLGSDKHTVIVCHGGTATNKCPSFALSALTNTQCYKTGGWSGNDGIIEDVGTGDKVWSIQLEDGDSDINSGVTINDVEFECTDEEGVDAKTIGIIIGCTIGGCCCCCCLCGLVAMMMMRNKNRGAKE